MLFGIKKTAPAMCAVLSMCALVFGAACGGGSSSDAGPLGGNPSPSPSALPIGQYTGPNPGGASSDPAVCSNYTPAPKITSVSPNSGPVAGGTTVTIKGSGFSNCSPSIPIVVFGDQGAGLVRTYNDSEIVVTAPLSTELEVMDIRVTVRNPNGINSDGSKVTFGTNEPSTNGQFTYK